MDAPQARPQPPKAAGLNNILNNDDAPPSGPSQLRDSGFYSTAEISSKHTSAASFNVNGLSPSASGYQSSADKTPSPVAGHMAPQTVVSPSSSHMSVAAIVSPTTPGGHDHRRLEHQPSMESTHSNSTIGENYGPGAGPRRESVDSRINQGLSDMRLGNSPYASNNQSTTSIQSQLHSQRNPRPGLETPAVHRISNGYAPSAERNPDSKAIRTAPAITGPATGNIARAAEPTKGQAWAFPEDELRAASQPQPYDASRRSSITESIASSQYTADSRLPPGQRRLEDGPSPPGGHLTVPEYPHHHHSMQHRQLDELQAMEGAGPGSQPYSRTPELRVSHKLAERKRRTEMKELFDALRDEMPQERGSKASKWEILTKAINEHRAHKEYIKLLQNRCTEQGVAIEQMRRQLSNCRCQDNQHYTEPPPPPQQQQQQQQQQQGPPRHTLPPQAPQQPSYPTGSYANSDRTELPPLRSISGNMPNGPESMTGVQYESGHGNANGYR